MAPPPHTPEPRSQIYSKLSPPKDPDTIANLLLTTQTRSTKLERLIQELHNQNQEKADYIKAVQECLHEIRDRAVLHSPGYRVKGILVYLLDTMEILQEANDEQLVRVTRIQFEVEGLRAVLKQAVPQ